MNPSHQTVLSASRRTDIPAFYMDWFMAGIDDGCFTVKNPFNGKSRTVSVTPQTVHTIVFWSKNFGPFLSSGAGRTLAQKGFHLYFNFTVNSESEILEPGIPALSQRLDQLEEICSQFGPQSVCWRFDPVCFYRMSDDKATRSNLTHFPIIAQKASQLQIKKCVTSFFDDYVKIQRRIKRMNQKEKISFSFVDPDTEKKQAILNNMSQNLNALGIDLYLCCEKEVFESLEPGHSIRQNACIDGRYLQTIHGGNPVSKKDYGQRAKKGCQCTVSIDVGSYDDHPCHHNCLFCYANPDMDR